MVTFVSQISDLQRFWKEMLRLTLSVEHLIIWLQKFWWRKDIPSR